MKALTANQMREADRRCIEEVGMPSVVLMNTAGTRVFEHVNRGPVGIVCGKGNNGGDGFVVARLALLAGYEPRVVIVGGLDELKGDPAIFLKATGIWAAAPSRPPAAAAQRKWPCATAPCCGRLLGTGIRRSDRSPRAAIDAWPEVYTIAVDLPSGLDADTGDVCGNCVQRRHTVVSVPQAGSSCPKQTLRRTPGRRRYRNSQGMRRRRSLISLNAPGGTDDRLMRSFIAVELPNETGRSCRRWPCSCAVRAFGPRGCGPRACT